MSYDARCACGAFMLGELNDDYSKHSQYLCDGLDMLQEVLTDESMPMDCLVITNNDGRPIQLTDGRSGDGFCVYHDQFAVKMEKGSWRHG